MQTPHQALRRFLPVLALLFATAGVILACGGADNAGSTTSGGSSTNAPSASHFKVGSQVKVGDTWVVTVNSAKLHAATEFDQPKAGNTYLVFDITFKNVSTQEQSLSSLLQLKLQDATGQNYTETITSFAKTPPDGKVEAGSLSRGEIVYEIPKAQKAFTLAFEADIVSGGQTIWDIKL